MHQQSVKDDSAAGMTGKLSCKVAKLWTTFYSCYYHIVSHPFQFDNYTVI
jgi:hypothetical protein